MSRKGFTLIELLIVIAIIAILALIAIPNFLEAQTRAKATRAKADMRTIAIALEAYCVDQNVYLRCCSYSYGFACADSTASSGQNYPTFERLTTPIAYVTGSACFMDPFAPCTNRVSWSNGWVNNAPDAITDQSERLAAMTYKYMARGDNASGGTSMWSNASANTPPFPNAWIVQCIGPARQYYNLGTPLNQAALTPALASAIIYDPTNGTISTGGIWRVGGQVAGATAGDQVFFQAVGRQQ